MHIKYLVKFSVNNSFTVLHLPSPKKHCNDLHTYVEHLEIYAPTKFESNQHEEVDWLKKKRKGGFITSFCGVCGATRKRANTINQIAPKIWILASIDNEGVNAENSLNKNISKKFTHYMEALKRSRTNKKYLTFVWLDQLQRCLCESLFLNSSYDNRTLCTSLPGFRCCEFS